jgi:hypothetical protein
MIKCANVLPKNLSDGQKLGGKQVIKFWRKMKKNQFFWLWGHLWQNLAYSYVPPNQMVNKQFYFKILTKLQGFEKWPDQWSLGQVLLQDNTLVYKAILVD